MPLWLNALSAANLTDYLVPIPKNLEQREGTFNRNSGRIIIPEMSDNNSLLRIYWWLYPAISQTLSHPPLLFRNHPRSHFHFHYRCVTK